ncbi:MAG: tripartite tricarboxylate transporter substrate binding protein [Bosea sp. (in: a-proteobacteria)]
MTKRLTGLTRRTMLAAAALSPLAAQAQAQPQTPWPTPRINLIVGFPPGGSTDAVARLAQTGLQQRLGVPVTVDNRPGGSSSIGANAAAKSPPDGGTFLVVFDSHAVLPALLPNLPYDNQKDLAPVMLIGTAPMILATHKDKPYKTMADVMAATKASAGGLNYGSIGNGSLGHLTMTLLSRRTGAPFTHVPFRGGGPLVNDAVAGHIELAIGSSALLAPQIAGGNLRALMQTGEKRAKAFPDLPTATESGFQGLSANAWWAVFAPAGTPAPLIERMRAALEESFKEERVAKQMTENQQIDLMLRGPAELATFLSGQMKTWGDVVRENNIRPD